MKTAFLNKAEENLRAAAILFENSLFNASANRAYFAVYQAAIAGLANIGISATKNKHKWVQATFNRELIKRRKIYPSKVASHLLTMLAVRNTADYEEETVNKKVAKKQLSDATEFIGLIKKELCK